MRRALLSCVILLGAPTGAQEPLPAPRSARPGGIVRLADGARFVRVVDAGAAPGNVERIRRTAIAALAEIERAAGFPSPRRGAVVVHVHPDYEATGGYAGLNDGRRICVQEDIPDHALLHELAHDWFSGDFVRDPRVSERWIVEGLAEYTAIRAERALLDLGDPAWHHAENVADWTSGFGDGEPLLRRGLPRYPLPDAQGSDTSAARARDWYGRAYAFFHLLAARIGHERLAAVNAAVARFEEPAGSVRYLHELGRVEPDIVALVRGWHTRGEFHADMHPDRLLDRDGDGLCAALERAHGTDDTRPDTDGDGLTDGAEVLLHGTDPTDARSGPTLVYAIDGDLADWSDARPSARFRRDPPGDLQNGAPPAHDLRAVWIDADETYLYAAFRFAGAPPDDVRSELAFDADGDGTFDVVVGWGAGGAVWVTRLDGEWSSSDPHRILLAEVAASGADVELALPRAALGRELAGDVRIWAYTLHAEDYADDLAGWIPLRLP